MEINPVPHKTIIFVCCNRRPDGERICCAQGDSELIHQELKNQVKERRLNAQIRVSKSGCLDRCEQGPNVMVFPANRWYAAVKPTDIEAILADLETL